MEDKMYVNCGTCGHLIHDTLEENTDHFERGQDNGYGICVECGGLNHLNGGETPNYLEMTEKEFRKHMGFNYCMFIDARINLLKENISRTNLEKFNKMKYQLKASLITKMMESGAIKW